jgi:peptidoglycan/LPS O-acetylase OafA/YrhL
LRTIRAIAPATPSLGDVYDRRRNNFDVLRFGLASAVIWSHCYALAGRPMDPVFWLTRQIDAGSLAVEGFFVLSGFLITQSWDGDPDLRGFAVKRALRLVPALVVALVFGAFVIGPLTTPAPLAQYVTSLSTWAHFGSVALHRYLASPLLFADNPVPHQLNASLWSLRYEILCYGVVALLGSRGARWSIASALLLTAGLAGTALTTWMGAAAGIPATLARLVACFFAGSLLYALRRRVPFSPLLAFAAVLALAAGTVIGGFRLIFPLAGTYLLLFLACWPALPLQHFGRHGDFSYGLYVFAYPIQQSIVQWAGPSISMPAFFALAYLPTLTLAVLSWHFIEAPSLARKPRRAPAGVVPVSRPTGPVWAVTSSEGSS